MVITHEQWFLTRFLSLDSLELKLVQFSWILELWIIIYELITNYPRLFITPELIIKQKIFYNFISEINLNSNYRIENILLLNLVRLLRISKVQIRFEFELNWIDLNKSDGKIINSTMQPGCFYSGSAQPAQRRPSPTWPFNPRLKEIGDSPALCRRGLTGRFWSAGGERSGDVVLWS
jgi:hypothetical protein